MADSLLELLLTGREGGRICTPMTMNLLKVLLIAVVALAIPVLFVRQWAIAPKDSGLSDSGPKENQKAARSSEAKKANGGSPVSTLKRLLDGGEAPRPTPEQLRAFVEKQKHGAASLLAAWQLGGDAAWLEEAARRHPDDPRVALAKLGAMKEINAEAAEWIQRLKQADPGNATGWCYEALSAFNGGSLEAARAALAEAAQRGRFDAYPKEAATGLAEAYRSAGVDGLTAEMLGLYGVTLPQAQLAMNVQKEAISQLAGNLDDSLVQDLLMLAKSVRGEGGDGFLVTKLVGSAMERKLLAELNTLDLVPGTRKFVLERLGELDAERSLVRDLVQKTGPLMAALDESELKQYFRRTATEGELKAMQWLLARHPEAR